MGRVFQEERAAPSQAVAMRDVAYGTLDRQKLDIYLPKDRKPRAVIVFFYGGGWKRGDRKLYRLLGGALTGRGYALVVPDYRVFPEARFPAFVEDAALAMKWVRDNARMFGNAPLFLMGHSAGAHIGALLSLDPSYLRAHDIENSLVRGFIGLAGPYTLDPAKWDSTREIFVTAQPAEAARPIKLVREGIAPILLLHGANDKTVGVHNSEHFADALKAHGNVAQLKVYPRIGHLEIVVAFAWPLRWRAGVLDDVDAFVTRQTAS
jgi:acetyl esterase/lipase